jgi:hypothetical protein
VPHVTEHAPHAPHEPTQFPAEIRIQEYLLHKKSQLTRTGKSGITRQRIHGAIYTRRRQITTLYPTIGEGFEDRVRLGLGATRYARRRTSRPRAPGTDAVLYAGCKGEGEQRFLRKSRYTRTRYARVAQHLLCGQVVARHGRVATWRAAAGGVGCNCVRLCLQTEAARDRTS